MLTGGQCHPEANVFFSLGGQVFFLGEANVGEVNKINNFEGSHFVIFLCNGIRWPKEPVCKVVLTGDPKSRFKKKFGWSKFFATSLMSKTPFEFILKFENGMTF